MTKNKQKKSFNFCVCFALILFAIVAFFAWNVRYELFPSLIKDGVEVHFLTAYGEDKVVRLNYAGVVGQSRFNYAIEQLVKGPSQLQRFMNTYSEIPADTGIIAIIEDSDKNIIDLTSAFNTGGGTESIYNKLHQLINTVEANTDKPTYLFINGQLTEVFGGEGIMITQPLSKDSL